MRMLLQTAKAHLEQQENLTLVTVIASSGATPRGAGAHMLVGESGLLYGTIGGGAVEYRSIEIAQKVIQEKASRAHDFSLTKDDVQALGMICGGDVKVFFTYLSASDQQLLALLETAEERFQAGDDLWLVCAVSTKGTMALYDHIHGFSGATMPKALTASLKRKPTLTELDGQTYYLEQINSAGRVYVFGCGHVAQELVPVLSHVGFRCIAMDDREEFAQKSLFPDAEDVLLVDFNHINDVLTITGDDYACVMTRGHAYDAVIQAQLLRTPAAYIGVIGSARKKAGVYQKLREEYGFGNDDFARITSPIGLDIQAETPAEIAISIAAQLIAVRANQMK
mgnify:CR=1 FL=1